ncbi:putative Leu operon leader peptide [Colwellia psychrerythraea 34H]|uniref:Putative Leu operon leader peptide n=1 Tax=Colwellia psychrerythraea (strain 34H / ATCC BAA-681) TaxID=167879 RepID=Q47WG5_COLP3|nr:putative Leu operon leader peptide [Colwellia psychrerythraea 34H]
MTHMTKLIKHIKNNLLLALIVRG